MEPSERALDLLRGPTGGMLRAALAPTERLTHAVPAVGCTLVLTTRRLLVIRDGSAFRPKSGVRDWPLDTSLDVRTGLVRHRSGSLIIRRGRETTSVFVSSEEWAAAIQLVGALRSRTRRALADGHPGGA
jgi:hypothetical protein